MSCVLSAPIARPLEIIKQSFSRPSFRGTLEIQDLARLAKKGTLVVKRPAPLSDGQYGFELQCTVVELADWLCVLSAPTARLLEIRMRIFLRPSFGGDFALLAIFGALVASGQDSM